MIPLTISIAREELFCRDIERFHRTLIGVVMLWTLAVVGAFGQFRSTQWNADSGLPQNSVRGIVQTPDGYMWVATLNGVVRFDGVRFTVFDKSNTANISSNRFTVMAKGKGGDFWLVAEDGNIVLYHEGSFRTLGESDGVRPYSVGSVTSNDQGAVWIISDDAIYQWNTQTNRFEKQRLDEGDLHFRPLWWIGTGFWALHQDQFVYLFHGELHRSSLPQWIVRDGIKTAAVDTDGTIWIALEQGLVRISNGRYQRFEDSAEITFPGNDKQGWVMSIQKNLDRHLSFPSRDSKNTVQLNLMTTDHEGNTWIGSERDGLVRIQRQLITVYSAAQGLGGENVYPVLCARNGDMWVGTWPGALSRIREGKVLTYTSKDGLPQYVNALAEGQNGDLWVGTHGGVRVLRGGKLITPSNIPNDKMNPIQVIYPVKEDLLLLGSSQGVFVVTGSRFHLLNSSDGLAADDTRVIIKDHLGNIWVGGYGGITQLNSQLVPEKRWTERNGLPSKNVRSIYEDAQGNIWVGTYDGGLGLFRNGKWTSFDVADGMYDNGAFQILEDKHQNLWMSSNRGIYRVNKSDLYAFADGKKSRIQSVSYGKADGMLNIECNGGVWPGGAIDKRGYLWFPTQNGVAVLNPEVLGVSSQAPEVILESVSLEHKDLGKLPHLTIEPGQSDLEIQYTALNFTKPEQIEFRYKLAGLDRDWEYVGRRRTAYYKHLPPGNYTFHVAAINSDGVWSTIDQSLAINVIPPFYQRWWFIVSVGLILLAITYSIWNYRLSQLQRARAQQKAFSQQLIASQESERHRIAAELHDGLGQRLVVIRNLALLLLRPKANQNNEEVKRQRVEEISSEAAAAMEETRAISYGLRPLQLDRLGLSRAIHELIQTASLASGIEFKVDLDDIDEVFPNDLRINFFRIVQEAINNIIKHSGATAAEVVAKLAHSELYLTIHDDGHGLRSNSKSQTTGSSGFGITGMRERSELLNGSLTMMGHEDLGTTLKIIFHLEMKESHE